MSKDSKIQELENIPNEGLLRIKQVLKFIPVSRSSWWAGVKSSRYPKPHKLSPRVTCWKASDIRALIEKGGVSQ
jgi:prophage regulatory protein